MKALLMYLHPYLDMFTVNEMFLFSYKVGLEQLTVPDLISYI